LLKTCLEVVYNYEEKNLHRIYVILYICDTQHSGKF